MTHFALARPPLTMLLVMSPFILTGITWLVLTHLTLKRLRERHAEKYCELGKPSIIKNNKPIPVMRYLLFVFSGQPRLLGDTEIDRLVTALRIVGCLYAIEIAAAPLLFSWVTKGLVK